jgi:hypothetical protein
VATDRALRERIVDGQDAALDRLEHKDFGGTLLQFMEQVQRAPRRPHPPVAFDFWEQVKLADAMEEIRLYRPAAFQVVPVEEAAGDRP